MGFGMGLVMSPMSTAAMNSVDPSKAGVASGTLSMSRMVGGSFGVAAMGALIAGPRQPQLAELLPNVSDSARSKLTDALGSGASSIGDRAHRRAHCRTRSSTRSTTACASAQWSRCSARSRRSC
jgi:hypothetical protein